VAIPDGDAGVRADGFLGELKRLVDAGRVMDEPAIKQRFSALDADEQEELIDAVLAVVLFLTERPRRGVGMC